MADGGKPMNPFHAWHASMRSGASRASMDAAADAARSARESGASARQAARDLARLELIAEAMWELVKEKTGLIDEDLLAKIAELDLTDGTADGRKRDAGPIQCPKCSRPNSRRHDFCIYCGELIRTRPFQ
jgi:hypothetical protein